MSKKKHKSKGRKIKPDQVEYIGPLRFSRYGKYVHVQNLLDEQQVNEFLQKSAKDFFNVCSTIDKSVAQIRDLVKTFDPLLLLQCGFFTFVRSAIGKTSESEYEPQDIIKHRMIDYIQSVIVSTPIQDDFTGCFDQATWDKLFNCVMELYSNLNLSYHISHSAHLKLNSDNYDENFDELFVIAQMLWTTVRGKRYQIHDIPHLESLLLPHEVIFKELFNISIPVFISGLKRLQWNLTEGLPDAVIRIKEINEIIKSELQKEITNNDNPGDIPEIIKNIVRDKKLETDSEELYGKFIGFDLFDVQKNTNLPDNILNELSFEPGEYLPFYEPGEFCGWPLRLLPVQIRPFLKVGGKYYCFDLHNLFDYLYRVIQRLIIRLRPDYKNIWNEKQKIVSENLPFELFRRILPKAHVFRPVYHMWPTGKYNKLNWCETDGLIIYDDHLIIIEVKGGAFTYTPPATDFPSYLNSIKSLLLKPAEQAKRFLDYLESDSYVDIFDSKQNLITKLNRSQFRHITLCCVTLDSLTTLAAQHESIPLVNNGLKSYPIWSVSVDDLRVYADIFTSPLTFLHFLQERQRAYQYPRLSTNDELEHISLYLTHNRYVDLADSLHPADKVSPTGFLKQIDQYYHDLMIDPGSAKKPSQKLPSRMREVLDFLEDSELQGRAKVATYLLDMSGENRRSFSAGIEEAIRRQKVKERLIPFSFFGETKITVFCCIEGIAVPPDEWKRDYVLAFLLRSNDKERLSLSLFLDVDAKLIKLEYEFLSATDMPSNRMQEIKALSAKQANDYVRAYLNETGKKKIGRNEVCPCGSGKKYKKCCGK